MVRGRAFFLHLKNTEVQWKVRVNETGGVCVMSKYPGCSCAKKLSVVRGRAFFLHLKNTEVQWKVRVNETGGVCVMSKYPGG